MQYHILVPLSSRPTFIITTHPNDTANLADGPNRWQEARPQRNSYTFERSRMSGQWKHDSRKKNSSLDSYVSFTLA